MSTPGFRALLYYKYVSIESHEKFADLHLNFCKALGLHGRIIIAPEGINGTVSGTVEQTDAYMYSLHSDPRFGDMVFKIDEVEDHVFKKMHCRARSELVTFRLEDDVDPNEITGIPLEPKEFFEALQRDDVLILDVRNDYEYDLGHFRNAIRPDVRVFKEFPKWVRKNLQQYKDKKVLTYCTGGIRCEKFTGFLVKEGFQDVAQLRGGVVSYAKDPEVRGRLFDGKLYVFDERIATDVNTTEEANVISRCSTCGEPSTRYRNCANLDCHRQFICCEACERERKRSCSPECENAPRHEYVAS